ncbi:hypothetical protein TNCV_1435521 [Trichonephila clavipes]|nr:hypothetical protein TNCV_1435521 [Trichonephila clavipes]
MWSGLHLMPNGQTLVLDQASFGLTWHWSVESDLRVSLVNNGLVGPYSATVLVTLPSAPDHRPPRLESAR